MTRFMGAPSPTTEPHGACISRVQLCFNGGVFHGGGGGGKVRVDVSVDINWLPIGIGATWVETPHPLEVGREASPTTDPIPLRNRCLGLSAWPSTRVIYLGNVIIRSSTSERPPPFGHRLIKMVQGKGGEGYIDGIRRSEYLDDYFWY